MLYTGLIFTLSSIPQLAPPGGFTSSDKLAHVGEYLLWGLLLRRALDRTVRGHRAAVTVVTLALGGGLAFLDESFQRSVGRDYSYYDMAADVTGVVLAQGLHDLVLRHVGARGPAMPGGGGA